MKKFDFLEVGNTIHLVGSLWLDTNIKTIFGLAIDNRYTLPVPTFDFDETEKQKFLNQANIVECRAYEGLQRKQVKQIKIGRAHV